MANKLMELFTYTKPKMIVASRGKRIRDKNDIEHIDENGNFIKPYYSTTIFVPDNFTEQMMNELYVEEELPSEVA